MDAPADYIIDTPHIYVGLCIVFSFYWKKTMLTERNKWKKLF